MAACPNKKSQEWKDLSDALGEDRAMLAFIRNGESIPTVEKARELITNVGLLESLDRVPFLTTELVRSILTEKGIITDSTKSINGKTFYEIDMSVPNIGTLLGEFTDRYGMILEYADDKYVTANEVGMQKFNSFAGANNYKARTAVDAARAFLSSIGVHISTQDDVLKTYGSNGVADFANWMVKIQQGAEMDALPEEALHFFLDMIDQTTPELLEALDKIRDLPIYKKTLEQYKNNPNYRTADGQIRFDKIKKEALAKHIASLLKKDEMGDNVFAKLWKIITDLIKGIKLKKDPMDFLKDMFLANDIRALNLNLNSSEIYNQLSDEYSAFYQAQIQTEEQKETVAKILSLTSSITFESESHRLAYIDATGVEKIMKSVTKVLGSDFKSELEGPDIVAEIIGNYQLEFGAEAGVTLEDDTETTSKKLVDYIVNLILQDKITEEQISTRIGDRVKDLLYQASENKRKTLFGTAVHSIAESVILNKDIDLDALDPMIYNLMDRKTLERMVYGTATEPGIVGIIRQIKDEGNVIMTEVEVGNGELGGIVDIIAIDKNGIAKIYDFKTKFINPEKSAKKFSTLEEYFMYATGLLSASGVKDEADTLPELVGKRRSQMEKYNLQMSIYKKLLMQYGITVGDTTIIGIPYTINTNTNKVSAIKPFITKPSPFNDKIASGYFPNLNMALNANASQTVKKAEDDRIKLLEKVSKEKMKEAFVKMESRLTQLYNYFSKNRDARAIYEMLNDIATKTNRVKLQRDVVADVTNNFDEFATLIAAQRGFIEIIDSAGPVIEILSKRFEELKSLTPTDTESAKAKLQEMMKIRDFLVGYENMFSEMLEYTGSFEKDNPLTDRLNQMVGAIRNMRVEYRRGITPEIIKMVGETFTKEDVDTMRRAYNELIKSAEERGDKARVEELKKELEELPSDRVIADLLNGNKGDVGWFFSKFLPAISNPDILIASIAKRLKTVLDKVRLINIEFRDRLGKEFNKRAQVYGRGLNVKAINESLVYIQKTIESRSGKEFEQMFFLSEFDEKLYYDYYKLVNKLYTAQESGTAEEIKAAKKEVKDFELRYLQSEYTSEFFKLTGILDAEVTYRGVKQTVREIRQGIFDEINAIYRKYPKEEIESGEMQEVDLKELQQLWERLSQLQEKTYPDGTAKTGDDLRIANILERYAENSKKIYENVELSGLFERKKERIKLTYGENSVEYENWIANNTRLVISDEYYKEMDAIMTELGQLTNDVYAERKKELFNELRTLTKAFKDKDGYIKGQLIDEERLKRINDIQDQINTLNDLSSELTSEGYTKEEAATLKRQRYLSSITDPGDPLFGTYDPLVREEIVAARNERLKNDPDLKNKIKRIKELKDKLFAMRQTENTKYYYEELENQERLFADAAGVSYEELKKDNELYQQFRESAWYQQNHKHKVFSRFNSETGEFSTSEAWEPIYVWRRNKPIDQYIQQKPARHFYKNVLRDSYVNDKGETVMLRNKDNRDITDRLKPKTNEEYKRQYGQDHPYLNKKYVDLRTKYENNTATEKERVDYENLLYLHKELLDSQKDIEQRFRLGFAVPFMEKPLEQRVIETGGKNILESASNTLRTIKRGFVRTEADLNEGVPDVPSATSRIATVDNEEVKYIPVRFASKSEATDASYDVWGAVLNYVSSINRKKELEKELAFVNGLEELLADPENQPKKETRNLILNKIFKKVFKDSAPELEKRLNLGTNTRAEVIKSFINTVMYGEEYFEGYDILGLNTQKTISRAMRLSSFTLLGFAPFNWTVNALSGNIQVMIEAAGGKFMNFKQFRQAKKLIYVDSVAGGTHGSIIKDMMADFGKVGNRSFWGQMMDYYDPIQGEFENEFGQKTSFNKYKNILSLGAFAGKVWGEWEIQTSAWVAFMKNNKLYEGKVYDREQFITMKLGADFTGMSMKEYTQKRYEVIQEFENLKVDLLSMHEMGEDGKVRIKEEYKDAFQIGSKQFSDVISKLHAMQKRINGSYAAFDKAYVQKTSLGRMLFFFRRYFVQLGMNRWGTRRPDYEGMSVEQGFYLTFYQTFIKDLLKFRFNIAKNWQSYSPDEKAAIRKTLVEIGIILSVMTLSALVFGYDEDDEDRFKKLKQQAWGTQSLLFTLLKVNSETGQFLPIAGAEELNRIYSNPSILWSQITSYISMSKMVLMHIGNLTPFFDFDKSLYYQKDSGESFLKEEGDSKLVAEFIRTFTGYTGKTFNPVDAVKGFEFSQRIR